MHLQEYIKKLPYLLVAIAFLITSCANVSHYQTMKADSFMKAQMNLEQIRNGCQKKTQISNIELVQIDVLSKPFTKKQYLFSMCNNGAKYIAFKDYFEDKVAWKQNLREKSKVLNDLYHHRITKVDARSLTAKSDAKLQAAENTRTAAILNELSAKDQKAKNIIGGVIVAAIVIAAVAVAANHPGGGGSSYSGNCACPYDLDAAGNPCGARSAYSRSGGASPQC